MIHDVLPLNEAKFFSSRSPAHRARLLEWSGDLYRAVPAEHEAFFRRMISDGLIDRLVEQGRFVATEATRLRTEEHPLLFRHRRLPFVTCPFEWSAQALSDAALLFIDMSDELANHDIASCDGHPWNIVFDGASPRFVDMGSFTPLHEIDGRAVLSDVRRWFVYPLRLMADGRHRIARAMMQDPLAPIDDSEFELLSPTRRRMAIGAQRLAFRARRKWRHLTKRPQAGSVNPAADPKSWRRALASLRDEIESIRLNEDSSDWSDYYPDDFPSLDEPSRWNGKQQAVAAALHRLQPKTVHDVAGNRGWYSMLAQRLGAQVVCTDIDEPCLNHVHRTARSGRLPITAARMNLRNPAPALGWSGRRFPDATERLQADCVIALALVHHMVFGAGADFDRFINALAALTRRDLVLEFVSADDPHAMRMWNPTYDWYALDHLAAAARRRFGTVRVTPAHSQGRCLVICESKCASEAPLQIRRELTDAA